jgi:hypothetical protein
VRRLAVTEDGDTFDGERVLWSGQPTRFPIFDRVGVLLTAVGIYCLAGGAFTIVAGARAGNSTTVILAALMTTCVLVVVIGRPLLRRSTLRHTRYLLTRSRIAICSTVTARREQVAHLRDLSQPILSQRDGATTGTIRFDGSPMVLLEIENPRQVHQLITTAQADSV